MSVVTVNSDSQFTATNTNMQLVQPKGACLRNLKLELSNQPLDPISVESDTRSYQYIQNVSLTSIQDYLLVRAY